MLQNILKILKTVITVNKKWVYRFDSFTKSATSLCKHTDSQLMKTNFGGVMIVFFNHKGVIYQHALLPEATVNGEYCVSVLKFSRQHKSSITALELNITLR